MKLFKYIFIFCLSLFIVPTALAQETNNQAIKHFVAAEEAYKQGDFAKATEEYESIVKSGKESGNIYYNLANSYYKQGKVGKAILNYKRALQFMPRDSDTRFNYHYVQSRIQDSGDRQLNFFEKLLQGHIEFYALNEMIVIICILSALLGTVSLISLFTKWPVNLRRWSLSLLTALWMIYVSGFVLKIQADKNLGVVTTVADAYFEPRNNSTVYFKLFEGTEVKILKKEEDWFKIERLDGKLGWVHSDALEKI